MIFGYMRELHTRSYIRNSHYSYTFIGQRSVSSRSKTSASWFLLGNSPRLISVAWELPRRKHKTFRTRRKFEVKNTSDSFNFISVNMSLANIFIKQCFFVMYERVQLRSKTFDVFKKLLIEHLNCVAFPLGWQFKDWRLPEYYTNTLPTSKRTQSESFAMNSRLILYREITGTHCRKLAKRVRTLCG